MLCAHISSYRPFKRPEFHSRNRGLGNEFHFLLAHNYWVHSHSLGGNMKQKTKNKITAAFILFFLVMVLLCIDTLLSGESSWYVLYLVVVITITIPLGLLMGHLLATLIIWCWTDEFLSQQTTRLISATKQRLSVKWKLPIFFGS
jgi:hypothetical protein